MKFKTLQRTAAKALFVLSLLGLNLLTPFHGTAQCVTNATGTSVDGTVYMMGQTFTPASDCVVGGIRFSSGAAVTGANLTINLRARNGGTVCNGTVLRTATLANTVSGDNTVTFSSAVSITNGTQYFLEIVGAVNSNGIKQVRYSSNSYGGTGNSNYYHLNSGATCLTDVNFDLNFTINTGVLKVELLNLDATTEGSKITLNWSTVSEENNKGFDIERSRDGETFQTIGNVKGIGKAANYNFVDANPYNGVNYYRLRQVDYDGLETLSKVVSVSSKGGKALKVYPTLVSNGFLTVDTEGADYAIYNIVGQQVQNGKTTQRLDVSALAKGTYILKVGTEQAKFIKQ